MISFLPAFIKVPLAVLLVLLNTVFWMIPLVIVAILKLLLPLPAWQRGCRRVLAWIAECWIGLNNGITDLVQRIRWDVEISANLDPGRSWLIVANHQSWADIVVLQRIFNRRIPFMRFFLKRELVWVPLLGIAWWALDFPFMRRHSREFLERHPERRGEDLEITRRACRKFRSMPVSIMNFVEGTRFTPGKQQGQQSPYRHLLRPRAGGVAFTLNAMQGAIRSLLDVTIVYQPHRAGFADLFSGRLRTVTVRVRELAVPARFLEGDYQQDAAWRAAFQEWISELWQRKDAQIDALLD